MGTLKVKDLNSVSVSMCAAMRNEDEAGISQALNDLADVIASDILQRAAQTSDANILMARGNRALTSQETEFYQAWIRAGLSENPKQALLNGQVSFPETIIDQVFDDIIETHELLAAVNFVNTSGAVKFLVSRTGHPKAIWGALTAAITEELEAELAEMDMTLCMLSAFIPVNKSILDLGPVWLDNYVRTFLREAIANGCEDAMINNLTSNTGPIGMIANLASGTVDQQGVVTYPKKTKTAITDLSPATVGAQLKKLAKSDIGTSRKVTDVILVVNPEDYYEKVFPATTVLNGNGTYVNNVLPYPIKIIQSAAVEIGEAVLGMAKRYFMGIGYTGSAGRIEFSDEYKFIEHKRYYKTYLYGNGKPMDNKAFVYLNISGLQPAQLFVTTVNVEQSQG